MGVSGNLWIVVKDVKTLVVYDVRSHGLLCWAHSPHPWLSDGAGVGRKAEEDIPG